jgi:ABC transporter substrate binding protein
MVPENRPHGSVGGADSA